MQTSAKKLKRKIIILDGLEFEWEKTDIQQAKNMFLSGIKTKDIAKHLKRHEDEIILLALHLVREKQLPRSSLLFKILPTERRV